jgi:hypothetical protein
MAPATETSLRLASRAGTAARRDEIRQLPVRVSSELEHFWMTCGGAEFFRDIDYDQWGLDILAPWDAVKATHELAEDRPADVFRTDLMIGRFRGDSDFVVIRCDPNQDDFGQVVIGLPLDRRADWYFTRMCFSEFLRVFIETRGQKFWEAHA